jgi:hypothetical protein
MKKKLFLYLLKKYTKTEEDRFKIYDAIHEGVSTEYNEQTMVGNIYNGYIEFLMTQPTFIDMVAKDDKFLEKIKEGLNISFDEAIKHIKNSDRIKKLKKLNEK